MVRELFVFLCFCRHYRPPTSTSPSQPSLPSFFIESSSPTQRCLCLIPPLLFYSFFHFLRHLCLTFNIVFIFSLSLSLHRSLSIALFLFAIFSHYNTFLHLQTHSIHSHCDCSFLWKSCSSCAVQLFRREYLPFCMVKKKNLWWTRESRLCSSVSVRLRASMKSKMWNTLLSTSVCITVCVPDLCSVILIILTSWCPNLGGRQAGGWWRVREGWWKRRRNVLPL